MVTYRTVSSFLLGMAAGMGGFYLYKQNEDSIDAFFNKKGMKLPKINFPKLNINTDRSSMTLKELISEKERLEDLIAERETEQEQVMRTKSTN